jgi:hypothetical protein
MLFQGSVPVHQAGAKKRAEININFTKFQKFLCARIFREIFAKVHEGSRRFVKVRRGGAYLVRAKRAKRANRKKFRARSARAKKKKCCARARSKSTPSTKEQPAEGQKVRTGLKNICSRFRTDLATSKHTSTTSPCARGAKNNPRKCPGIRRPENFPKCPKSAHRTEFALLRGPSLYVNSTFPEMACLRCVQRRPKLICPQH